MAHLPDELVERLLRDEGFQPGGRPSHFRAPVPGSVAENPGPPASTEHAPPVGWLFKETGTDRNRRRHSEADRWRNSGGKAGARDLPAGAPVVRRRYGKLTPAATNAPLLAWCAPPPPPGEKRKAAQRTTRPTAKEGFAYHEYTLLDPSKQREDGALQDDVSRYLFHVVPVRDVRAPCPPCSRRGRAHRHRSPCRVPRPQAMAEAPRLGLPQEVELSADETRSLSAILRVEKFEALPGTNSAGELGPRAQPPGAGLDGASAAAAAGAPTETEVLPVEEVIRRICDTSYEPGTRPALLKPAQHGWIFKEPARPGRLRRGQHEDRWKHSGGTKGAKDLYLPAPSGGLALDTSAQDLCDRPVVRRRNGVIQPPGRANSRCYRYNQYTLLRKAEGEASGWEEDPASPILFHVQPPDSKAPRSAGRKKGKKAKPPPPPLPDAPSEYCAPRFFGPARVFASGKLTVLFGQRACSLAQQAVASSRRRSRRSRRRT